MTNEWFLIGCLLSRGNQTITWWVDMSWQSISPLTLHRIMVLKLGHLYSSTQCSKDTKGHVFIVQVSHFLKLTCIREDILLSGFPFLRCLHKESFLLIFKRISYFTRLVFCWYALQYKVLGNVIILVNMPSNKALLNLGYSQAIISTRLKENLI